MENRTHHAGDCDIYSSIVNQCANDGICTCGYALSVRRQGNGDEYNAMYSKDRQELMSNSEYRAVVNKIITEKYT